MMKKALFGLAVAVVLAGCATGGVLPAEQRAGKYIPGDGGRSWTRQ